MKVRHKLAGLFGVAVATAAMTSALGGTAGADTGYGSITPVSASLGGLFTNPKCLDVRSQDPVIGGLVQQWDCSGASEQQWAAHPFTTVQLPGSGAFKTLYQLKSGRGVNMCMEVRDGSLSSGARIDQNTCAADGTGDAQANQLWLQTLVPGTGYYTLQPWSAVRAQLSLCIDVPGANTDNGVLLQLWSCNGTSAQRYFGRAVIGS
jgi:hypothetical protein